MERRGDQQCENVSADVSRHRPPAEGNLLPPVGQDCTDHIRDDEVLEYVKSGRLCYTRLSSAQWSTVVSHLLTSRQSDTFFLLAYVRKKRLRGVTSTDEVLQKLMPVLEESRSALLGSCYIKEKGCAALASTLRSNTSKVRKLSLSQNFVGDSAVILLCDGLKDPQCKLEELSLNCCSVSERGCAALASVLEANSNLKELDLGWNKVGDSGVKLLSAGLKDPHCKLEVLRLGNCEISEEGCADLASVLRSNSSNLVRLDISTNFIGDSGMKQLSAGLKDPHCKLEELRMINCAITGRGCVSLASVLRSKSSKLRELNLIYNELGDSGVKLLSAGLKAPHCKLEKLLLSGCGISDEGFAALASVLRSNSSNLRELDLTHNKVGDSGVKLLSDIRDDPHFKLETLDVKRLCWITK